MSISLLDVDVFGVGSDDGTRKCDTINKQQPLFKRMLQRFHRNDDDDGDDDDGDI